MKWNKDEPQPAEPKYPGQRTALDGSEAVVAMETAASEGAGAYPITPSTQMGEGWAAAVAAGKRNVNGRRLLFFEPEGEHAAAAVTAGMSMTGLRAANFSSGQGIAYMHESLYPAVGKRLTYVLNVACRAMTKHALNVHAGHDDYHAIDDTGFFQLFAKNVQEAADLNLVAHRIAELSLNPGLCAQDGFLTSHVIEALFLPERDLVKEYLGDPSDVIDSPTPAQRMVFGEKRRRIPEMFDFDYPTMLGVVQNQDSYAQGVAAQRPFYFDHIRELADRAMEEFYGLTGRRYDRASGYRLEDAEFVIAGQGSMIWNAEAVADYLRKTRGLAVGVLNLTMFRPFPADRVTELLRRKKAVTVLERTDQPLAVDLPLAREIRAAMSKALENGRARNGNLPHPRLAALSPGDVPELYSGVFGLGSRDLQPGDLIAAVENMLPQGQHKRLFYLGIDFIRKETRLPKLQIWQERLVEAYPDLGGLALESAGDIDLMPEESVAIRIHSVGGWGAITMGKNLAMTAFELLGWHIKANPKYGSEKKGQPTTFYATLAKEPIRLNSELKHVDVVLSPDPNVLRHSNPLLGLAEEGVFVIQSNLKPGALLSSFPAWARRTIEERRIRVFEVDAFQIASDESSEPGLRYRMQGAAFMGAFFRVAGLMEPTGKDGLDAKTLFDGIRKQLEKKFGHLGREVVEDNLRVIRRGFEEVKPLECSEAQAGEVESSRTPQMPAVLDGAGWREGIGNPGRFWEQVAYLYKAGEEPIADPFAALSAIPAATSTIRDMTDVRFEVPDFVAEKCTGCSQCWVVCPDAAIPGVVNTVEELIDAAIGVCAKRGSFDKLRQIRKPLASECRRILKGVPFHDFAGVLSQAYKEVVERLGWDPERRAALDEEFAPLYSALAEFPLAKTQAFFDLPESQEKGTGGLLSITVNPDACKGCNLCVEVCPDQALVTIEQDEDVVRKLRRNWRLWEHLPDTHDRYVKVGNVDEGIGVLSSLLLKKDNYRTMFGGDGACMGCGEKTGIHLLLSAVTAVMQPRVDKHVKKLEELIAALDEKARGILASDADLEAVTSGNVDLALDASKQEAVRRIAKMKRELEDLRWRYTEGPSGKGRALTGFSNATGCSSVWGSTYPYNPYPFPWTNHLFQDAPSIAIGLFEGHMRKMADGFVAVRRAELELSGEYDPAREEELFGSFDWHGFSDEEFRLCPPLFAVGGDGAMLDIGFQNASRLMASGKPIRIVVLDTQVYSNTGGQACTSGFLGQVSDMAAFGKAQHGKQETRKEMALIAMAHRGTYVLQSSQALPSHLLAGVIKGLNSRRPSVFILHCPCPPEHGLADNQSTHAAKLSLESRAFPFLVYDPDAGETLADCIDLEGNPAREDDWPTYELKYRDSERNEKTMEIPLTIADWAATESRFKKHFGPVPEDAREETLVPFHEYLELQKEEREGRTPFIHSIDANRSLRRVSVAEEIVTLARERLALWHELREMAGEEGRGVDEAGLEASFAKKLEALRAEYEAKIRDLKARYPQLVARRMAEGLLRAGNGGVTVADLLAKAESTAGLRPLPPPAWESSDRIPSTARPPAGDAAVAVATAAPVAVAEAAEEEAGLAIEPYIETARCTSCNECTNLNKKMFAYDERKQAYIKDARAGTFRELVTAAERCPVRIIHPGTPLDPKEKDLEKWVRRAEPFQ